MAHSSTTTNFNLPQFAGTDHPSFTGDFNEAFRLLDSYLKDIRTLSETAQAKADEAYALAEQGGGGVSFDDVYPVGSIYMSMSDTEPASIFGGTWSKIEGRFLYPAEAGSVPTGTTGGEAMHTLTEAEMPAHNHSGSGSTNSTGNHSHDARNGNSFVTTDRTSSSFSRSKAQTGVSSGTYVLTAPDSGIQSSGYSTASDGSHSHTVSLTIGNAGSGQAHNNMPPYIAVNCWQRTA